MHGSKIQVAIKLEEPIPDTYTCGKLTDPSRDLLDKSTTRDYPLS